MEKHRSNATRFGATGPDAFRAAFGDWPAPELLDCADDAPEAWRVEHAPNGRYLARLVLDGEPTRTVILADTLPRLRANLPPGLERLPKLPGDPPEVLEMWL